MKVMEMMEVPERAEPRSGMSNYTAK